MEKAANGEKLRGEYPECLEGSIQQSRYFYFDRADEDPELTLVFGGHEVCNSDFEISRASYPYHVLEFPLKGNCVLTIAGQRHVLKKNYVGGFTPGVAHHYRCEQPKYPLEHFFLAFKGGQASRFFERTELFENYVVETQEYPQLIQLAQTVFNKALEKSPNCHQICNYYLRIILLELARKTHVSGSSSLSVQTCQNCKKYIDDNYSTIFLPHEVAEEFDITVRHLSRLFRQYLNTSPREYIMRLKCGKAAVLLLTTGLTVKRISVLVGFDDPYHFSRNFKLYFGYSPRDYRNAHA